MALLLLLVLTVGAMRDWLFMPSNLFVFTLMKENSKEYTGHDI